MESRMVKLEKAVEALEHRLALLEQPSSNEKLFRCVQCDKDYLENRNPEGICHFHTKELGDSWSKSPGKFLCCLTTSDGCQRNCHSPEHHNRFPYSNYNKWFYAMLKRTETCWVELKHVDLSDTSEEATAEVGLLDDNITLYIRTGKVLKIYENAHLPEFASEVLILCEEKLKGDGFARITLESPLSLLVSVKSASDSEPETISVKFSNPTTPSSIESIQEQKKIHASKGNEKLPVNKSTGPILNISDPPEEKRYEQEGNSELKISLSPPLDVTSDFSVDADGFFKQFVTGDITIFNSKSTPVLITEIWSEFNNFESKWVRSVYPIPSEQRGVTIESMNAKKFEVKCAIKVKGRPGNDNQARARLHGSLPIPLKIRFNVDFIDGTNLSIIGEKVNPKLSFPDQNEIEEKWNVRLLHFAPCDDTFGSIRHYVGIYRDENSGDLVLRNSVSDGKLFIFSDESFKKIAYAAKVAGETNRIIDWTKENNDDGSSFYASAFLNEDAEVIGLGMYLKTQTGSTESYFDLRLYNRPSINLSIISPLPIRRGQLITIHWKPEMLLKTDWIGLFPKYSKQSSNSNVGERIPVSPGVSSGEIRIPLQTGEFEVRYMSRQTCIAKTPSFLT